MQGGHGGERVASQDIVERAPRRPSRTASSVLDASCGARSARASPRTPCSAAYHGGAVGHRPVADEPEVEDRVDLRRAARRSWSRRRAAGRRPSRAGRGTRASGTRRAPARRAQRLALGRAKRALQPQARQLAEAERAVVDAPGSARARARAGARDRRWASGRSPRRRTSAGTHDRDVARASSARMATHSASGAAAATAVTTGGGRRRRRRTSGAAVPTHHAPHAAARMALGPRIDARQDIGARRTPGATSERGDLRCTKTRCPPCTRETSSPATGSGDRRPRRHGRGLPRAPARPRPPRRAEGHRPAAAPRTPTSASASSRESRAAASIDHPNVIPIYYAGESDGRRCTSRCATSTGDDLRTLVRARGRAGARRAPRTSSPRSARALDAAHARGIVHRDVKPANVLLGAERPRLPDRLRADQARDARTRGSTRAGDWVGTLDYVAPEQIRGERVDARADVYALGCVLFYALAGRAAVPARERRGDAVGAPQRRPAAAARPRARACPRAFDAVIARAHGEGPRRPLPVGRRPRPRRARGRGPSPWRRGPSASWRVGAAAPGDTPGDRRRRPTRRRPCCAAERARARAGVAVGARRGADRGRSALHRGPRPRRRRRRRRRQPGDDDGGARRAPPRPRRRRTTAIKSDRRRRAPERHRRWPAARRGSCAAATTRLAVIDAKTAKRDAATARASATRAARPPASASSGSINQAAPSLRADRADVAPPGAARPIPLPAQGRAVAVAGGEQRDLGRRPRQPGAARCASTPTTARSRPRPSSCPTACRTSPSAAAPCGSSRGAAQHGHAPRHRQRHAAPDLRRREARPAIAYGARRGVGHQQRRRHGHADRQRVAEHAAITGRGNGPKGIAVGGGRGLGRQLDSPRRSPASTRRRNARRPASRSPCARTPTASTRQTATTSGSRARSDGKVSAADAARADGLEVARRDDAGLQRLGHQPRALLVLRQVLDPEALEQRAQVRLDRVDAEVQLVGDLLVGRRARRTRRACTAARARRGPGAGSAAGRRA